MEFKFNKEGKTYGDMCGIEVARGTQISTIITTIKTEIINNPEPYAYYEGEGENEQFGLYKGRCLARFFEAITDTQERYMLMFAFDWIMHDMCDQISKNEIAKKIDELLGMKNDK